MAEAGIQIRLNVSEIHAVLCKKCQKRLRDLIKAKISEQLVDNVMGLEVEP